MGLKRSLVEILHDDGYGDQVLQHVNNSLCGKEMMATTVIDAGFIDAAKAALDLLSGSDADKRELRRIVWENLGNYFPIERRI